MFIYSESFSCNVSLLVFTLFHQISDVESSLNNCVTKSDDRKANVPKKALRDSFCSFMNIDMQVGKHLSNVGYNEVQSVFQRGRAVPYNG